MKTKALIVLLLTALLTGCAGRSAAPAPLPTVVLGSADPAASANPAQGTPDMNQAFNSEGVIAAGIVVPIQEASLAASTAGAVQTIHVSLGDQVRAGQVLLTLTGSEALTAAVQAANLELLSAEQALKTFNQTSEQARAAALLRLANAQKALEEAQKRRTSREFRNGSQSSIDAARADYILAKSALENAEEQFNGVADSNTNDVNRAAALSALAAARKAHDRALANLNYLLAMPNQIAVDQAEAELQAAQAEAAEARIEVDQYKDGPDPDALALVQARLSNAQAQLAARQAALDSLEIKAPFAGTVSKLNIHSGEWAAPGQPLLILADLSQLRVETTDLSERDLPQVKIGQSVTVLISALGVEVDGTVTNISPLADTLGGDVVYQTLIDLQTIPSDLHAGMSVDVSFHTEQ